jgi:type IV secretion system protein VirB6
MSICQQLTETASEGVAPALRAVDCLANETTGAAFGRLFGIDGALLPALTIILTLYIAWFAISLLTGRSRLGISALTPKMMTMGLVLTFATSWVAYQGVVWNLAVGAPDQVAGVLMGAKGSATQLFADRIDLIFAAIAEVSQTTGAGPAAAAAGGDAAQVAGQVAGQVAQGSFTPKNLMWMSSLLLLLGTVGVLVTARIALAVLLALGPIFVIFALFSGTRGLTAGWLRGVVLTAITPLFVVLGGGIMLELLVPVVTNLRGETGIDGRAALALFTIASVHVALMGMVLKVCGSVVGGWQVFGLARRDPADSDQAPPAAPPVHVPVSVYGTQGDTAQALRRMPVPLTPPASASLDAGPAGQSNPTHGGVTRTVVQQMSGQAPGLPPLPPTRARGVGSRFRAPPRQVREISR